MHKERILVVDDKEDILELIRYNLEKEQYRVDCVMTGREALSYLAAAVPDLLILDLMLPDLDGLDVCRMVKSNERTRHVPIVMLTARAEDSDIVAGLELGADDYVTKPFSPRVLLARIRTILRRSGNHEETNDSCVQLHELSIDPVRRKVTCGDCAIELTASEFELLFLLAQQPGRVFSRDALINRIKGEDYPVTERSVDVQIASLRKKLGAKGTCIETVRGVGYRFKE